jgi:tetraacyldisaccharide 4'-kinase
MHKITPAVAAAFYIPGLAYEALIRARNGLYAARLLPQRRLPAPVISIGNLTMGGSGKTPLVMHITRRLSAFGLSTAILTRGYGRIRSRETHILAPDETVFSPAWILGDEPALMRRHLPFSWMGVSKDRFAAGKNIVHRDKRVIFVLDDGFQHRKLHRDLNIVVIDRSQPLESNRIFPRGTLREPLSGLCRSDVIMINGPTDPAEPDSIEKQIQNLETGAKIFHCRQTIRSLEPFPSWQAGREMADGMPVLPATAYLASAVGNPERFRRDVRQLGIEIAGARFFPDHCRLKMEDWQGCIKAARKSGVAAIITTEKDAVKIGKPPDFPVMVSVQSTEISDASAFELLLKKTVEEWM